MKGKKPKSELMPASKVLQTLLGNGKSALSDHFLRWKLWRFWEQVVGPSLGKECEPVGYERGRLYIWVKSSVRMQEVRFFEAELTEKINKFLGQKWVRQMRFTLDRRGVPASATEQAALRETLEKHDESSE